MYPPIMYLKMSLMLSFSKTSLYFLEPVPVEGEINKMHITRNQGTLDKTKPSV